MNNGRAYMRIAINCAFICAGVAFVLCIMIFCFCFTIYCKRMKISQTYNIFCERILVDNIY